MLASRYILQRTGSKVFDPMLCQLPDIMDVVPMSSALDHRARSLLI
jgi:hypothetical protein